MPSFQLFGWKFYFWNNEYNGQDLEPVHIHVCKGVQTKYKIEKSQGAL